MVVALFTQITRIAQMILTTNRTNLSNFCIPKTSKKTKINKNLEYPALQKNQMDAAQCHSFVHECVMTSAILKARSQSDSSHITPLCVHSHR